MNSRAYLFNMINSILFVISQDPHLKLSYLFHIQNTEKINNVINVKESKYFTRSTLKINISPQLEYISNPDVYNFKNDKLKHFFAETLKLTSPDKKEVYGGIINIRNITDKKIICSFIYSRVLLITHYEIYMLETDIQYLKPDNFFIFKIYKKISNKDLKNIENEIFTFYQDIIIPNPSFKLSINTFMYPYDLRNTPTIKETLSRYNTILGYIIPY